MSFDHQTIEKKWQERWRSLRLYDTPDTVPGKENEYLLVEYPYPSGNLHIGHWYAFAVPDIYARFLRMRGKNVLFPIGFDSFGLPAENAAIKRGLDPKKWTYDNIAHMEGQLKSMGNSFDWSRKVVASDPEYYKWTQWLFLKLYEKGLAHKKDGTVPWCDSCKTVLANEQIVSGACERCGTAVVQKELAQWYLKITDYAERLLADLDELDWPEDIKAAQREWIGHSEGSILCFEVITKNQKTSKPEKIEVFTTRADTLYGATYLVLAPEHPLVAGLKQNSENEKEIDAYVEKTKQKKELERKEGKEKTGVELRGVKAVNPATNEEIPVWIADYVLASYGTGAVMAVPAHDERDAKFAQQYNLSVRTVIAPQGATHAGALLESKEHPGTYFFQKRTSSAPVLPGKISLFGGHLEHGEGLYEGLARELMEELELVVSPAQITATYAYPGVNAAKHVWVANVTQVDGSTLVLHEGDAIVSLTLEEASAHPDLADSLRGLLVQMQEGKPVYTSSGTVIDSGAFSGMRSELAKQKITEHVGGTLTTQYRLRDWLLSRQRYWGCPIPIVYDPEGKPHAVPEEHLPWALPEDVDFKPTGEAPIAKSSELRERTERVFGKGWTPEVDTMDTFVDSSWYFLRYLDPHNTQEFSSFEKQKQWMPVSLYSGGAEHTTMHVLYSRFFYKALYDLGLVTHAEPYLRRMNRGLILGPDGHKMSKSKGNVVDPDEHVARVGADTVKMYLAFVGPYNEPGQYPWDLGGIAGVRRFLERVWKMSAKVESRKKKVESIAPNVESISDAVPTTYNLQPTTSLLLHQTIKKVRDDIAAFKFNTAISALMTLVNSMEKLDVVPLHAYETLLRLLAPFAPHLAEEVWELLGHQASIHFETWPEYDSAVLDDAQVRITVQVDGKARAHFEARKGTGEDELRETALRLPELKSRLTGRVVIRSVVVPDRLVSLVTAPGHNGEGKT